MNRMEQLTREADENYEPLSKFDQLVPKNSTVAVFLLGARYEYPLFGEYLTRTIIPINTFNKGVLPIPVDADYLLYEEGLHPAELDDLHLGTTLYLRKLR